MREMVTRKNNRGILAIVLLALLMFGIVPGGAFAHSALVSAVPAESTDSEVTEIVLTFNESIDKGSKLTVTNESGDTQSMKEVIIKGKTMTGSLENPLPNGKYAVDWRIISADGHPLKGNYAFEVNMPQPTPTPESTTASPSNNSSAEPQSSAETPNPDTATPATTPPQTAQPSDVVAGDSSDSSDGNGNKFDSSLLLIIGAAAVLMVVIVGTIMKRK